MTQKSLVAVLMSLLITVLSQRVSAIEFGDPNWVDSNNFISNFDGYSLTLYDLNMNSVGLIPIFDPDLHYVADKSMAWSPDGQWFIVLAEVAEAGGYASELDDTLQVWNFAIQTMIYEMPAAGFHIWGMRIAWKPDSSQFAVSAMVDTDGDERLTQYDDVKITIYDIDDEIVSPAFSLSGTFPSVDHLVWGANNHLLALVDRGIVIWDLPDPNALIAEFENTCHPELMPVFSPDGEEFACISLASDDEIQIWQTSPTEYKRTIHLPSRMWGLAWGQYGIVSIHYDGSLRIIDPTTLTVSQTVEDLGILSSWVTWNSAKTEFLLDSASVGYQIRDGLTGDLISPMIAPLLTPTP